MKVAEALKRAGARDMHLRASDTNSEAASST